MLGLLLKVMQSGERLIVLSRNHLESPSRDSIRDVYLAASVKALDYQTMASDPMASLGQHTIIVAMGAQAISDFADDFSDFSPKGSTATFILPSSLKAEAEAAMKAAPQGGSCQFNVHYVGDGNPASIKV
jgi:hypothetical protein